ncbi:hypothetical protein AKJ16_DCAP01666 [Drosera capensis]
MAFCSNHHAELQICRHIEKLSTDIVNGCSQFHPSHNKLSPHATQQEQEDTTQLHFQESHKASKDAKSSLHTQKGYSIGHQKQARVPPNTVAEMVEYFLDSEAQEFETEVGRMRPRLNEEFFSHLKFEIGQLRFAVTKTQDMEDRLIELEALLRALEEATEAYDKMQYELIKAKSSLTKIFSSKVIKATMVEQNEINKSWLSLLDENIATAHQSNQKQAVDYRENVRVAVLKYITV